MPPKSTKRHKRDRRVAKKATAKAPSRSQRRKAYERLFRRLGLDDVWHALPKRCREQLYLYDPLRWDVSLTSRARRHERARDLAALIADVPESRRYGYDCAAGRITIREAADLLVPVALQMHEDGQRYEADVWAELVEALDDVWHLIDRGPGGVATLFDDIDRAVFLACTMTNGFDRPYATPSFSTIRRADGVVCRIVIDLQSHEERRFVIEDKGRTAYRVGTVDALGGRRWIDIAGAMFDLGSKPVPAYVQAHALHRLWQRLELDHLRYIANVMVLQACHQARVVQREGETCWLAVDGPDGKRFGYLIASPQDGVVLIRTFTFLTASNAPEARKLRRLLREAGDDYRGLGLDELSTYLLGEVPDDPKLRRIFAKAGCAHLLEMGKEMAEPGED